MARINLSDLTKVYGTGGDSVVAVEEVSLSVTDGEFLVLVGPSGCGKSTTLRCIAGLEDVTEGRIQFGERDVTEYQASERDVAMVFQNYALYPHMTVRENIGFGLKLSTSLSSAEIHERVDDVAGTLGISELLSDKPKELSGGQQQRVALGRAIVREPEVFLMDEPLSNLDAKLRSDMRTELQELQEHLGVTTVYVTHDQTEAMAMGDRIAVMDGGILQQVGPPEEVYLDPANEFVADFIGSPSINLFTADVEGATITGPGGFAYELDDSTPLRDRKRVRVGIRPEDIRLVADGTNHADVAVVEPMGNENFCYMRLDDHELTARIAPEQRPEAGDRVAFSFEEGSLYLFDVDDGEALKTKTSEPTESAVEGVR
ncbi:ABC transporter ATP-binding protein [Halorubrum vacuolatum]|uniref:ABC-type D-xylose/L-arabinose transporter n=1 Tax=Halorubrum vacuolatum TaxID=63740 RepID=A0A238XPN9_HALVU|nr:ABC transporter ATP-binding protein [Halorubrum vacuolatum]SNR59969.1 carbohydrate ABC transporter ATP-binding protein, CUT1 family [Halorubrum vacuolatum]